MSPSAADSATSTLRNIKQRGTEVVHDPQRALHDAATKVKKAEKAIEGAYMYPISGVLYFANHPNLAKPIAGVLAKSALTSLGITALMFFFTFLPQMAFLSLIATPFLGIPAAIVLVLIESWLLINVIVKAIFIAPLQDDLFDRVLIAEGHKELVTRGQSRLTPSGPHAHVAKAIRKRMDRFAPAAMLQFLITLPLTFIPVIGPLTFFVLNGKKMGASFHTRYFALKGWKPEQVEEFQKPRGPAYTAFGVVALALQLIPVVGVFFTATSTVGAAIWAADLESHGETTGMPAMTQQAAESAVKQLQDAAQDAAHAVKDREL